MDISIEGVIRITISEIEEYERDEEDDEDEEENEPFYRTITIETESGVIEIDVSASSEDALELIEDDEDEE